MQPDDVDNDKNEEGDRLHFELVGMVEASHFKLNDIFRNERHLERYFLNAYSK
jgi:hypothetical protein